MLSGLSLLDPHYLFTYSGGWLGWGSGNQDSQVSKQVPIQSTASLSMRYILHIESYGQRNM